MNINALFIKMLTLFGIIIVGYIATKCGIINNESKKHLSLMIASLTNPMQILASVLSNSRPISNKEVIELSLIAIVLYFVMIFISKVLSLILPGTKKQKDIYEYLFIFSNVSFIGFPVIEALLGSEYTFYATVFSLTFQLFCYTYGTSLLSGEKMKFNLKLFLKPCIVAAVLAYVVYLLDIQCPNTIYQIFKSVGSLTSTIAMIIIGCSLAYMKPKEIFGKWQIYFLSLIKLVVLPIILFFVLKNIITDEYILGVCIVILSMPAATNATFLSVQYGADESMASAGVFLTTLISMATIPLIMRVLFGL